MTSQTAATKTIRRLLNLCGLTVAVWTDGVASDPALPAPVRRDQLISDSDSMLSV